MTDEEYRQWCKENPSGDDADLRVELHKRSAEECRRLQAENAKLKDLIKKIEHTLQSEVSGYSCPECRRAACGSVIIHEKDCELGQIVKALNE